MSTRQSSIYSVCRDRLLCLETLETVEPDWRESFYNEWREHEAGRDPKAEVKIRKAQEARAKLEDELREKEEEIKEAGHKDFDDTFELNQEYSEKLRVLENWIRFLRLVGYKAKAEALQVERTKYKKLKWTKDNFDLLISRMQYINKKIILPVKAKAEQDRARANEKKRRSVQETQSRKEARATAIEGMKNLISDLVQTELWASETSKIRGDTAVLSARQSGKILMGATAGSRAKHVIGAIQKLRARSENLRRSLRGFIDHRGNYSLPDLERRINSARREAKPWQKEFQNDKKDYTDKALTWLLGGDEKRPKKSGPDEPPDDLDFGGGGGLDISKTLGV